RPADSLRGGLGRRPERCGGERHPLWLACGTRGGQHDAVAAEGPLGEPDQLGDRHWSGGEQDHRHVPRLSRGRGVGRTPVGSGPGACLTAGQLKLSFMSTYHSPSIFLRVMTSSPIPSANSAEKLSLSTTAVSPSTSAPLICMDSMIAAVS